MGFTLWIKGDVAWAQGTYEYRPMGAAVIAVTDLFKRRDFHSQRRGPDPSDSGLVGQFASLGHLNSELRARRSAGGRRASRAATVSSNKKAQQLDGGKIRQKSGHQ